MNSPLVGHDLVISAYGTMSGEGFIGAATNLIHSVEELGIGRLLVVGGAGSLEGGGQSHSVMPWKFIGSPI